MLAILNFVFKLQLDKIGEVDDNLSKLASWDANIKTSIEHNSFEVSILAS